MASLTGVTVSRVVFIPSMSIDSGTGLDSFRGEIDGECSASLLLGLFTGVNGVFERSSGIGVFEML